MNSNQKKLYEQSKKPKSFRKMNDYENEWHFNCLDCDRSELYAISGQWPHKWGYLYYCKKHEFYLKHTEAPKNICDDFINETSKTKKMLRLQPIRI